MVDSPETTITAPVAPAAPASDVPIASPVVETPAVSSEVAASSPAVDKVVETTPAAEAPVESVLGAEAPKEPLKVETTEKKDIPAGDQVVKAETPTEVKVELPVYEAFKLPENVNLEKEPLDAFTKILGEIETGKLDHAGMQAKGQALIDLATKATADTITRLNDSYIQIHNNAKKARFEALKGDPDLGGDKLEGTISALQKSVSEYGGSEAQIAEFRKEVSEAGIDASPALCRLIYNMQQKINKYTTEGDTTRQVPAQKPAPSKVKDYQRFYQG